jgi:hypothetical protein
MFHPKLVITLLLVSSLNLFSQCPNSNFEYGNFTGWQGRRGTCCPLNLGTAGIAAGRQTIMTQGIDPHSCGGLSTVYQGNFSARLGNDGVGSRAEALYYTFTVTPQNTLIQYAYAVVLQDPGHNDGDQPAFQSRVRLPNGNIVPCTEYYVSAGPNLPGYHYCPEIDALGSPVLVAWSDWRVITLDVSAYVGQTLTLEFITNDCALGRHYGYAYIDAISCGPIETEIRYCQASDSILVMGPSGFATYEWEPTGDTTQTIIIPSGVYSSLILHVTTVTGCALDLPVELDPIPLFASIVCEDICLEEISNFINLTLPVPGYNTLYLWDFGDGTTSTQFQPSHLYINPGTYIVTMTASVVGATCTDITTCEVTVNSPMLPLTRIWHD